MVINSHEGIKERVGHYFNEKRKKGEKEKGRTNWLLKRVTGERERKIGEVNSGRKKEKRKEVRGGFFSFLGSRVAKEPSLTKLGDFHLVKRGPSMSKGGMAFLYL